MSDSCTNTTTCFPCEQSSHCEEGCPIENFDACCVQYKGENLENIGIEHNDSLCDALVKLNDLSLFDTAFIANSTKTIRGIPSGTRGHSPLYHVRLNPENNAIIETEDGLQVKLSDLYSGKVKVNKSDSLDYLENQLFCGNQLNSLNREIIKVCPTVINGAIYLVPTINKANFLDWVKDDLCNLVSGCIPAAGTTTTSTTTTSSSSTTTSSSSTTSTTTMLESGLNILNTSGYSPINVIFRDSVSLIDYTDINLSNNQGLNTTYTGSINNSSITIQSGSNIPVGIVVTVNGSVVYNNSLYIGSVTIPNILYRADVSITIYPYVGTTTTTTSSSSTSTTTSQSCVTVNVTNNTSNSGLIRYQNCSGYITNLTLNAEQSIELCILNGTLNLPVGFTSNILSTGCNTTTTSSSTSTTTYYCYSFEIREQNTATIGDPYSIEYTDCNTNTLTTIAGVIGDGQIGVGLGICSKNDPPAVSNNLVSINEYTNCGTSISTSTTSSTSTTTLPSSLLRLVVETAFGVSSTITIQDVTGFVGFSLSSPLVKTTSTIISNSTHSGNNGNDIYVTIDGTTTINDGIDIYVNDFVTPVTRINLIEITGINTYVISGMTFLPTDDVIFSFTNNA